MSVVSVVLTFLVNVYVIEEFTSSVISVFALALFNFSRILSKIMIVPHMGENVYLQGPVHSRLKKH